MLHYRGRTAEFGNVCSAKQDEIQCLWKMCVVSK